MKRPDGLVVPDFIAVGPPRTATTWLNAVLKGRVTLPRGTKETDFFLKRYPNGIRWYARFFRDDDGRRPVGEICPTYFDSEIARERIARELPGCKIICTLREPVERLFSYYKLMRRNAWTRLGFEEAILRHRQMQISNRYASHIRAWRNLFGDSNVMVTIYDDLIADPQAYLDNVCDFIGAPSISLADARVTPQDFNTIPVAPRNHRLAQNARHVFMWLASRRLFRTQAFLVRIGIWSLCFNGGSRFSMLDHKHLVRLRSHFNSEIDELENLLHRDLSAWRAESYREASVTRAPGDLAAPQAQQIRLGSRR